MGVHQAKISSQMTAPAAVMVVPAARVNNPQAAPGGTKINPSTCSSATPFTLMLAVGAAKRGAPPVNGFNCTHACPLPVNAWFNDPIILLPPVTNDFILMGAVPV